MLSSSARSVFRLSLPEGLVANDIFSRRVPCENTIGHCTDADDRDTTHKLGLQGIDLRLESLLLRVISIFVGLP